MKYHKEKKLRSDLNLNVGVLNVGVDILLRLISRLTLILFCLNTVSLSFANDISSSTLPTNAEIVQGSAVIQKQNNRMDINQNSDKVILGWEEFDIGSQAHVNFDQPSEASIALNRVRSSNPSRIYGKLSSNGQVFLQNPGGVIFGQDAQVDVGGLVATTMDIDNEDFNSGKNFFSTEQQGSIVNKGKIKGDYVALMATNVQNDGTVEARLGSVALVSGDNAELKFGEGGTLSVAVKASKLQNTIENSGGLYAEKGSVILKASAVQELVEQTIASPVSAKTMVSENGVIKLIGNSGTIRSQIVSIDAGDNGGVEVAGKIDAKSKADKMALISITGKEVVLKGSSKLSAKSDHSGGKILLGGDWQGKEGTRQAVFTTVEKGALVDASADKVGDGGTLVVWSDIKNPKSKTIAQGRFLAKGGTLSGDGGKIETSGHYLLTHGIKTSVKSMNGKSGEWLLDPYNITIGSSASGTAFNDSDPGDDSYTSAATSEVLASDISTALENGHVTIQTGGTSGDGNGDGDIIVSASISKSGGGDKRLTLKAHNDVTINSTISSSNNDLDLVLWSDSDANGSGGINLNSNLSTNGGNVWMGGGSGSATWKSLPVGNGNSEDINIAANVTTNAASQRYNGPVIVKGGDRTLTTSSNQQIEFTSTINSDGTPRGLTLNTSSGGSSEVDIDGAVGGSSPLSSMTITTNALTADAIKLNGALTVNNYGTSTITGAITDGASAANLVKAQSGTLTISGNNTFTGSTAVNAGTLKIVNDDPTAYLAATSGITGSGSLTIESSSSNFSSAISTTKLTGNYNLLTLGKTGNTQTINLTNDITTTGDQRYNGPVVLSGGNRTLTTGTSNDDIFFESTVNSDGTARSLTVTAGTNSSGGIITFTGAVGGTSELSALTSKSEYFKAGSSIRLAGLLDIDVHGNSSGTNYGITGGILDGSSSASLNKGGSGGRWLELKGNNSYTGPTTIEAGYLKITNDNPHTFLANTTISGPGHLQIAPTNANFGSPLTVSGINLTNSPKIGRLYLGKSGISTKLVLDADITTNGRIYNYMPTEVNGGDRSISTTNDHINFYSTIDSDTTAARSLTINSGSEDTFITSGAIGGSQPLNNLTITAENLNTAAIKLNGELNATLSQSSTISGAITNGASAANLVKAGNGTLTLSGANTYTGTTEVDDGDLTVTGSLHDDTAVTIASGADYNVNASDTVASIAGAGNINLGGNTLTSGGSNASTTFSGVISGTSGSIVKAGTGTLTLQGNNSYTGSTTISHASGKIKIERDAPLAYLGSTSGFTGPGSLHVLPVSSDFSEAVSSANITLVGTWLNELIVGKAASSSTLYIDSHIRTNGIQTYNGPTVVRNGNWELETSNDAITFEDTLNSDGTPRNLTITTGSANLTLSGAVGGSNPLNNLTITTNVLTAGDIKVNDTLSVTNSGTSTISGVISNGATTANLVKAGSGLLNLTGISTYTGSTTISAGTLKVLNDNPTSYLAATSGFTGPGNLTIESAGGNFTADIVTGTHVQLAGTALGNLIIGKSGNSSIMNINSPLVVSDDIKIYSGNLTINSNVTSSNSGSDILFQSTSNIDINGPVTTSGTSTLTINSSGNVNDGTTGGFTGGIVSSKLLLSGSGNYNLNSTTNNVTTLSAGTSGSRIGSLMFLDSNELTVGSVASNNGIFSAGTISVSTLSGDLTASQNINTQNTSSSALILNSGQSTAAGTSSGGNINFSGGATITMGTGGRATLYSGSVSGSTGLTAIVGSGSNRFRYNSDENSANFNLGLGTGIHAIYRERPSLTIVADDKTVTYGTSPTLTTTVNGLQNGDTAAQTLSTAASVAVGGSKSSSNNYTAGTHSLTASSAVDQLGYLISGYTQGTLTVNRKSVTASYTASDKTYDSTAFATVSGSLSGVVSGDSVSVSQTSSVFSDPNVADGKTVTVSGISIGATDASNYTLQNTSTTTTADISEAVLQIIANADAKFVTESDTVGYKGVSYYGFVGSEDNSVLGGSLSIARSDASNHVAGSYTLTPSGLTSSNYDISFVNGVFTIVPANQLLVELSETDDVVYSNTPSYSIDTAKYLFCSRSDCNVGLGSTNTIFDMKPRSSLSGRNFSLNDGANGSASFTIAPAGGFPSSTSGNVRAGSYALTATNVTETHVNFSDTITLTGQVTYTKKPVTVSITASNKVYDRLVAASASASMSGVVSGDVVSMNTPAATFSDKDAGNNKTVTMSGISISGTDVANYNLQNFTATTTANITPKPITASYTASDKVYDRLTNATVSGSLTGVIFGDTVTVDKTSSNFSDINVGNNKTVSVSGISIGGPGAPNYSLQNNSTTTTATITRKSTTASYTASNKTYDRNSVASVSGTLSGIISGDDVSVNYTSANFSDRHAENSKTVTVSGINIFGSSSSNYSLQNTSALTSANIAQKTVRASFAASDKVYDRETSATVTSNLSGVISGDTVTLSGVTANFSDKTASQNKTITVSSNISGTDSNNYFLENSTDYILASIIRKPLTAYFQALNKVYDGTSKVEVAGSSSDVISGDQVIFEYDKAKFIDDTIGTEKQVLVTGIFLSGSDAGNYELLNTSAITSATVAAPADVAGSVYYIDWSTPTYVNNGTSCAGCIDWRKLYEMLDIDETLKSIINWVNLSREDKKKSASREDKKSPGQKLL